jgi:hypothetical protein
LRARTRPVDPKPTEQTPSGSPPNVAHRALSNFLDSLKVNGRGAAGVAVAAGLTSAARYTCFLMVDQALPPWGGDPLSTFLYNAQFNERALSAPWR